VQPSQAATTTTAAAATAINTDEKIVIDYCLGEMDANFEPSNLITFVNAKATTGAITSYSIVIVGVKMPSSTVIIAEQGYSLFIVTVVTDQIP